MKRRTMTLLAAVVLGLLVFAAAGCGGDDNGSAADTTTTTEATTTETTETTETTTTETTDTTEATETTETTPSSSNFATSENCRQFAQIGAKISSSLSGQTTDLSDVQKAFDDYAAAAPADIKDDFQTLADWFGEVADALGSVQAGQTPSAAAIAKLQAIDSKKATQASQNIATWVQQNCT